MGGAQIPVGADAPGLPVLHHADHHLAVVEREDVVLFGGGAPSGGEVRHLVGHGCRQVVQLVGVFGEVVEFPLVLREGLAAFVADDQPERGGIIGPVAAEFEILLGAGGGLRRVEGGGDGFALHRLQFHAIAGGGGADSGDFQHRRHQVYHMDELLADRACIGLALGPADDQRVGHAAQMGELLVEPVGRVGDVGPADGIVGEGGVFAHHAHQFLRLGDGHGAAIGGGEHIGGAGFGAFGRPAIVGE